MPKMMSMAQYIKAFTQESAAKLTPFIVAGKYNIEFIKGNQNKYVNTKNLSIEDKKASNSVYLERKVFNRMLPIYLTRFGILSKNMPIPGFKPQDNSAKRQFDAVRGNDFIKNFLLDSDFKKEYNKLISHCDTYALAWIKTGIDWSQGDDIATVDMSVANGDEKEKSTYTIKEGRPFIEIVPMYEVFIDNMHAESDEEINELVHRRAFACSYIKRKWGFSAKPEKMDTVSLSSSPKYSDNSFAMSDASDYAYVYEYYKRADAEYPNGRYTLMINDNIIYDGILPYQNSNKKRVIPFNMVTLQNIPNYTVGISVYSQIIPIQETYNAVKNRYLEYVNHIAIGQMYIWEGSLVNKNQFTTKPGKLIEIKRNARPPQAVQKATLTNEFIQFTKTLEEDMLITAGLSQMTAFGVSRSNVRTDGVVDKIDESDQNKLVNAVENLSAAIVSAFKKVLYCEKDRVKTLKEKLKLAMKDDYAVKYKLDNVDPEQLTVANRDFLMQDDQLVDKKLQRATELGLYDPSRNLSYISKLHLVEALQSNYLVDTLDPNQKATHDLIESEHFQMLETDNLPQAEYYHIHEQHIVEHNIFRISPEVRMLSETDPDKYKILMEALDSHIKQHEKFNAKTQQTESYKNAKAVFGSTANNKR